LNRLWIALLILAACRPSAEKPLRPQSANKPETVTSSEAAPVPVEVVEEAEPEPDATIPERNITIRDVKVGNPLVVTGLAPTFENNVVLRARASDGTVIAEGFTTSNGEMGKHNPYSGSLWLTRTPGSRILVEALEYSAKDGAETNLVRVEKPFNVAPIDAVLYFPDEKCLAVKPYTRRIPKTVSMARLLAEALVKGPTAEELSRGAAVAFPEGSAVRSVILRDGVLTVDFNERLQNVGGSCRAQMIRASVTETMSRLPTVKKVLITAGGSDKLALQP
jgi:hypothetical protein